MSRPDSDVINHDFPTPKFNSQITLLRETARVYFGNFWFIATCTLLVWIPVRGLTQLSFPENVVENRFLQRFLDLIVGTFLMPVVYHGILHREREGVTRILEAFQWGLKKWSVMLVNAIKVKLYVLAGILCLIVPGFILGIALWLVAPIIAIEGTHRADPFRRSCELTLGRRRFIFIFVWISFALIAALAFLIGFLYSALTGDTQLEILNEEFILLIGSVLGKFQTVASLLIYLKMKVWLPPKGAEEFEFIQRFVMGGNKNSR